MLHPNYYFASVITTPPPPTTRAWWHGYYAESFLTLSDSTIESFYWVNMYKLASATRADRAVYDLMGPWYIEGTSWPDLHW